MHPAPDPPLAAVQVLSVRLHALEFVRTGDSDVQEALTLSVGVATSRPARHRLGVDLRVICELRECLNAKVVFRAVFERTVPFEPGEDELSFWQIVVANMATVVLFPYVRVALATVISQAGLPPFTLPLVNPAALFKPDQIRIAELTPAEDERSGKLELDESQPGTNADPPGPA